MTGEQKIKLLVLTPTLECGGSEKYVSLLCNAFNTNRFDITLVVLNDAHPFYEIRNTIEVVDLKVKHVRKALFAIRRIVQQKQPDIIYSTGSHLNLFFAIFRWAFPKGTLFLARESSIPSINNRRASFPKLYNWLVKKHYRKLDLILCQSVFMQDDLVSNFRFPKNRTVVIPNPVQEIQQTSEGQPQIDTFITVARLSEEKGIDRLIHAVALLSIPFQFFIIGEGNKRAELQGLINALRLQDKIILMGEKINPYQHMKAASLMLMGSRYEGSPNALLEAGILGIPVIAFDAPGGIREIIREGENGLLVKDGDEKAFGAAIEKALQMNFNRIAIIAVTKERYALDKIIAATEELFIRRYHQGELL